MDTKKENHISSGFVYSIPSIGFALAVVSATAAISAGLGTRAGFWDFKDGFEILRWAALGGLSAAIISAVGLFAFIRGPKSAIISAVLGIILGLFVFNIPARWWQIAQSHPPIHDITTDTEEPPIFVAVPKLRSGAENPLEYGGPDVASKQKLVYPDVQPILLGVSCVEAFRCALKTAKEMDWEIVDANEAEGRIEAVDTTFWFGFKDDIAVRVVPADGDKARVDVRSVSRVGRGDAGTNAKRILKFTDRLKKNV